ncbi:CRE_collapsed_G0040240.mRNA.1.CDS.1 [Saccharomyces cerevisiae]|nr:CRE_HP_G0057640.mRNA.1.CDS.1 [Saccharomyces cerevisiae]CAI4984923.1 CRE_HP_G0061260.mRNA.1.CDS.1 [Saccharomyces cerevisiae]CAI6808302.1 CRE_HP_G0057640.mRNA.1.CDS.1 [Saccharomyces cerevisiae]CAI6835717.1 CRE_HP_G0061260.mRNA.1.CDS.1 [Saccharomyces cerevisiae]CAI7406473.1 CRE_collapsed_G0040240.mRNA.1.CDS.1 [Saccharomyces cerevisiae]
MSEATLSSKQTIEWENKYSAHNYHPLPVVFHKAKGAHVWDPEGKLYLDFLSAYSAVNQGHCHPHIIKALMEQAQTLTLSSRAFHNDVYAQFAKFVTEFFGFETVLPMNTGAEAVETALKLARRWGYMKKNIPQDKAIILGAKGNFHGRTFGAISLSTDYEDSKLHFGPFVPNVASGHSVHKIRYGHAEDFVPILESPEGKNVAAIILEPIQGEAGIVVPPADYFPKVSALCRKHNVLLIVDEIQTGIGRTGELLCYDHYKADAKPDIVLLGKALSGGVLPVSCVLSSHDIMSCFTPGSHGSTFGGNPLASRVAIAALEVIRDEKLCQRAAQLGSSFIAQLKALQAKSNGIISEVRGMGLLTAIVIDPSKANGKTAWDLCLLMKDHGLLAKPTHDHIIRLAPPLVISEEDLQTGVETIAKCIDLL